MNAVGVEKCSDKGHRGERTGDWNEIYMVFADCPFWRVGFSDCWSTAEIGNRWPGQSVKLYRYQIRDKVLTIYRYDTHIHTIYTST